MISFEVSSDARRCFRRYHNSEFGIRLLERPGQFPCLLYGGGVLGLGFIRGVFSAPKNSSGLVGLSPGGGMLFAFFISHVAVAEDGSSCLSYCMSESL
jgi:hypothetical protein